MRIDLGISLIGGPNSKDQRYIHITRPDVVKRIKNHPAIDPWTREYLIKKVNEYPDNALIFFLNNINEIVIAALNERSRILKEQNASNQEASRAGRSSIPVEQEGGATGGSGVVEIAEEAAKSFKEEDPERESLFQRPSSRNSA